MWVGALVGGRLLGESNESGRYAAHLRKNIGNCNLARCRHVTDKVDKVLREALGLSDLWEEIELEHSLVVRTSFEDTDDE